MKISMLEQKSTETDVRTPKNSFHANQENKVAPV